MIRRTSTKKRGDPLSENRQPSVTGLPWVISSSKDPPPRRDPEFRPLPNSAAMHPPCPLGSRDLAPLRANHRRAIVLCPGLANAIDDDRRVGVHARGGVQCGGLFA